MTSKRTKIIIGIFIVLVSGIIMFRVACAYCIFFIKVQVKEAMDEGNYEEAIDKILLYKKLRFEDETTEKDWALLGECYLGLGKNEEAIEHYLNALNEISTENDVIFYTNIGVAYARLEDYENALK